MTKTVPYLADCTVHTEKGTDLKKTKEKTDKGQFTSANCLVFTGFQFAALSS